MITATPGDPASENTGARPSASSAPAPKCHSTSGLAASNLRTVGDDADGCGEGNVSTVRSNPLKTETTDRADGVDANFLPGSDPEQGGGGIPFMITRDMRRRLHELGYSDGAIRVMSPVDAWRLIDGTRDSDEPMDDLMPGTEVQF